LNESKEMELVAPSESALAMVQNPLAGLAQMMHAAMEKGLTTENVAVMKEMLAMFERMDAKAAEKEFNASLARVQAYCRGKIQATKPVPNNDGTVRYRYAPLDEIMQTLQPVLNAEGMAVSFDVTYDNNRVFAICELSHKYGHKASKRYGVLLSAPPKASATQGDGSSITYAKRGAICNWFNIVAGKDNDGAGDDDNDARNIGELITAEQARDLEKRVKATGSNHDKFLKFAGVGDLPDTATPEQVSHGYEQIAKNRYEALDAMLKRKEKEMGTATQAKA